ncbi:unnamed protein product [Rangifer tarandus platyrhynchus]|uniref:Uncharacterized protein n=1 Tax=Rangifer tarandus platyrhynchus TaxID=3082113 RepID=A0ABN8Y2D8_RANTA|nr:unnamed protein product [Rangifer tarandus platyrhynchus]
MQGTQRPPATQPRVAFPSGRSSRVVGVQQKPLCYRQTVPTPHPLLLGAAHPVRAGTRRRGSGEQVVGATWLASPDTAPRMEPKTTFPLKPRACQQLPTAPGSSTAPAAVRGHSPAAPLPAAGQKQYQLRGGEGGVSSGRMRLVSLSAAQRGAASGSSPCGKRCPGIG